MAIEQIEYHEYSDTWSPKNEILKGTIGFQNNKPRGEPVIVIDGHELSWTEFGQTLLVHEGSNFNLEFIDPSDEK